MPIHYIDFAQLNSLSSISKTLDIDLKLLEQLAHPDRQLALYESRHIPKKSQRAEQARLVWVASRPIAQFHKKLGAQLSPHVAKLTHAAAHGFAPGRSTRTNAEVHLGAKRILHADIADFFPSILLAAVKQFFEKVGCNSAVADVLAHTCTVGGVLGQGLHTSPAIANATCHGLDVEMVDLASNYGAKYTRYADDLTFSGFDRLPSWSELEAICSKYGLALNRRKCRISVAGQPHFVTGLAVANSGCNIPKRKRRWLRQQIYFAEKFGMEAHLASATEGRVLRLNRTEGLLSYYFGIRPDLAHSHLARWRSLAARASAVASYPSAVRVHSATAVRVLVDECYLKHVGSQDETVALCVVVDHGDSQLAEACRQVAQEHGDDLFSQVEDRDGLRKKGLHFNEANVTLRLAALGAMRRETFDALIAFQRTPTGRKWQPYFEALRWCLTMVAAKYPSAAYDIVLEESPDVRKNRGKLLELVTEVLQGIATLPPRATTMKVAKKGEFPELAVPDLLLGAWQRAARSDLSNPQMERRSFDMVRSKIRIVFDMDGCQAYTRKRPFAHAFDAEGLLVDWDLIKN